MPRNQTLVTGTGVSAVAIGAEVTLVAATVVAAANTLRVTDLIFASNVTATFWIAGAGPGFVHIEQAYQPAGGGGYGIVSFNSPIEFAGGTSCLIRALAPGAAYTEATWTGFLLS